ncbi:MAG: sialate O-acetylesterase, partial [Clostridium celatum]|nr:sialate O-acetylesterase [Clostridium celatum]
SNTSYPEDYEELFETLINKWRENWNDKDLPFLYVQLANYLAPEDSPLLDNWAKVREAQRRILRIKNTGMAVAIDIGEYNDLHPLNKKEVGRRLALLAQDKFYNEQIISSAPMYTKKDIEDNKIILHFSDSESGLVSIKGDLNNFEISDEYGRFYKANAKIRGNLIEVWSNKVNNPNNVRYAWKNSPNNINLYNREGLPISPFTTEINYL